MTMDLLLTFDVATDGALQLRDNDTMTEIEPIETEWDNHTAAHLNFGDNSVLLDAIISTGLITTRSWRLNAGLYSFLISPRKTCARRIRWCQHAGSIHSRHT